jgi:hypothetical protein
MPRHWSSRSRRVASCVELPGQGQIHRPLAGLDLEPPALSTDAVPISRADRNPIGRFGATSSELWMSLGGRQRVYATLDSMPQTCRSNWHASDNVSVMSGQLIQSHRPETRHAGVWLQSTNGIRTGTCGVLTLAHGALLRSSSSRISAASFSSLPDSRSATSLIGPLVSTLTFRE